MVFDCLPLCPSPSVCVSLVVYVPSSLCVAGLVAIATAVCSALIGPVIQSHPKHHPQMIMGSGLIMVTSISLTVTLAFIKIHTRYLSISVSVPLALQSHGVTGGRPRACCP